MHPDHWRCAVLFALVIRVVEAIILYMLPLEEISLRMQGIVNPAQSPIHPLVWLWFDTGGQPQEDGMRFFLPMMAADSPGVQNTR
jgi:hypothetical protein